MSLILPNGLDLFSARDYKIYSYNENTIEGMMADGKKVILIILSQKLNTSLMRYYYAEFLKMGISRGILVYKHSVTSSVKNIIDNIDNIHIELFSDQELSYNVTKHCLVPQHIRILPPEGINTNEYPVLKRQDPVAKFYGYSRGDFIKIIRKNGSIYYRVVK